MYEHIESVCNNKRNQTNIYAHIHTRTCTILNAMECSCVMWTKVKCSERARTIRANNNNNIETQHKYNKLQYKHRNADTHMHKQSYTYKRTENTTQHIWTTNYVWNAWKKKRIKRIIYTQSGKMCRRCNSGGRRVWGGKMMYDNLHNNISNNNINNANIRQRKYEMVLEATYTHEIKIQTPSNNNDSNNI